MDSFLLVMGYDIRKIEKSLEGIAAVRYTDCVDSTNLEARRIAAGDGGLCMRNELHAGEDAKAVSDASCSADGILILAGMQTHGRGRMGRSWKNAGEDAIAMSLLLRPKIDQERVSMLTIVAAMAVSDGIRKATGLDTRIKWPNDLKAGDRKICGILSESVFCGNDFYSVIGIGINVNNTVFPDELSEIAGSVTQFTAREENREDIIIESVKSFYKYYGILCRDGSLSGIRDDYNRRCITAGGINEYGELIMPDGSLKRSGEV